MQVSQPSPFARAHTFFGICEAIGEDCGFNPVWLRVAFAVAFLANPPIVTGIYVGLGILVLATRLFVPDSPWFWTRWRAEKKAKTQVVTETMHSQPTIEPEQVKIAA